MAYLLLDVPFLTLNVASLLIKMALIVFGKGGLL